MPVNRSLTVRIITHADELAALESDWNRLAGGVPLRSHAWHAAWCRHYAAGASGRATAAETEPFVVVLSDSTDRIVAIAPMCREHTARRGRVLRLTGSGEVCSDYVTILCAQGDEIDAATALAAWLDEARRGRESRNTTRSETGSDPAADFGWDLIEFDGVLAADAAMHQLADELERRGCLVGRRSGQSCWRLALPGTWEDYLRTLSKSHRKQLRQLETRVLDRPDARFVVAADQAQIAHGLSILVDLHRRRRDSLGERGCFDSQRFVTFLSDVAGQLVAENQLRLCWLELAGRPIAVEFQLLGRNAVYAYQSGIDPAALEHEPGRLVTIRAMQLAISEGRHTYDLLRGDEPYKAHWRAVPHPTTTIRIAAGRAARLREQVWQARDRVGRIVKKHVAPLLSSSYRFDEGRPTEAPESRSWQ